MGGITRPVTNAYTFFAMFFAEHLNMKEKWIAPNNG